MNPARTKELQLNLKMNELQYETIKAKSVRSCRTKGKFTPKHAKTGRSTARGNKARIKIRIAKNLQTLVLQKIVEARIIEAFVPDLLRLGTTYNPLDGKIQDWSAGRMDVNLQTIAKIAALANDAGIKRSEKGYVDTGMPTEAALKVLVEKMGLPSRLRSGSSTEHNDLMDGKYLMEVDRVLRPGGFWILSGPPIVQ
ncbi:hypothetical protein L1887_37942 [Cichorium endivia]|nr:hypothetical protein L1887_37942 [Cichorium endivia]